MPHLAEIDITHAESFPMFALAGAPPQPAIIPPPLHSADAFEQMPRHVLADIIDEVFAAGAGSGGGGEAAGIGVAAGGGAGDTVRGGRGTDDSVSGDLVVDGTSAAAAALGDGGSQGEACLTTKRATTATGNNTDGKQ